MTANAAYPDDTPTAAMWDAPDDLDLGFDALISRYATHRLHDPGALARLRPDLARLIAPPEVTFAAYLADGTIVLCCPDGIPDSLASVVDVLDPLLPPPPVAAQPAPVVDLAPAPAVPADLTDRLDEMSRKLDQLSRDTSLGGQIADRLEEMKGALLNGLAQAAARSSTVSEEPDPQALAADLLATIQDMLQQTEQRMLTVVRHASRTPPPSPQIDGIEQDLRQVLAATTEQAAMREGLMRLQDQMDGLIARPTPSVDLSIQRQGVAQFLEAMGSVVRRLDTAIDRLQSPDGDPHLVDISNHLTVMVSQLDEMGAATVDLSPVTQALRDLRDDIGQSLQMIQPTTDAVQHLAERIDALAMRPDPVLDLTQQRQSFAQFGEAMAQVLRRLDKAAEVFSAQSDTDRLLAETRALRADLERPLAQVDAQSQGIAQLTARIADLADRPLPMPNLTVQRQAFAQFATVISQTLQRLEAEGARNNARLEEFQALAAQAILGVLHSQVISAERAGSDAADPPAALRVALAEAMASEFMIRGWQPVAGD